MRKFIRELNGYTVHNAFNTELYSILKQRNNRIKDYIIFRLESNNINYIIKKTYCLYPEGERDLGVFGYEITFNNEEFLESIQYDVCGIIQEKFFKDAIEYLNNGIRIG